MVSESGYRLLVVANLVAVLKCCCTFTIHAQVHRCVSQRPAEGRAYRSHRVTLPSRPRCTRGGCHCRRPSDVLVRRQTLNLGCVR